MEKPIRVTDDKFIEVTDNIRVKETKDDGGEDGHLVLKNYDREYFYSWGSD